MQVELDVTFVVVASQVLSPGDRGVPAEVPDGAVGVQGHVRDVGVGQAEMRRIAEVERLEAELDQEALLKPEIAGKREIGADGARSAQRIETGVAEAHSGDRGKCQRVEPGTG